MPELTNITVNKVWNDSDNRDAIRPQFVTVDLLADGTKVQTITIKGEDWTYTVGNLPKYNAGKEIVYTVVEVGSPNGYTTTIDGLTITNTHMPELTNITVNKVWDDCDNQDAVRPDSVVVKLLKDGKVIDTITLSSDNNWKHTFEGLAKYENGSIIVYSVDEENVTGYTKSIENCTNDYKITNTHIPEVTEIKITKVWNDNNNQDGIRPTAVAVDVLADGVKVQTITINGDNGWTAIVRDLPVYAGGKVVEYTINESAVVYGYNVSINGFEVTNTHIPEITQVKVTKLWDDSDNQDGKRTDSVTVTLYANSKEVNETVLDQNNNWTYTFVNLPKYDNGNIIVYKVDELSVPDEYNKTIKNCGSCYTITNTHKPELTNITVNKVWDDCDNQDGVRPGAVAVDVLADGERVQTITLNGDNDWTFTLTDLPVYKESNVIKYTIEEIGISDQYNTSYDGYTIINTHITENTTINVVKVWNDSDNQDGVRPGELKVYLLKGSAVIDSYILTSADNWEHTFENLPKYENGNIIVYRVDEEFVPYYIKAISYSDESFTITNTYTTEVVNVTVKKQWNDDNNQDGLRPDSVTVQLFGNNNSVGSPILLNTNNNWTYAYENLPKYDNGAEILYNITEVEVPEGYSVKISNNSYEFLVENTHVSELVNISVKKVWNDKDNLFKQRPADITVNVNKNGGFLKTVTLNEENGWTVELTLPKYENADLINYTVSEVAVENYSTNITSDGEYSFTITNTLKPLIFLWGWKLIGINETYYINGSYDYDYKHSINKVAKTTKGKAYSRIGVGKYKPYNKISKANKYSKWNNNKKRGSWERKLSRQKYRLFIYLYNAYFYGDMSYSDFVAILKENGIVLSNNNNWDSNGVITIDYDDIKDVPDSIELHDNKENVPASSDDVEKNNPISSSGVIDEGQVSVEIE